MKNKIFNENCLDTMFKLQDNSVDMIITSPPYDNLRAYKGFTFDFDKIAPELYRVLKSGGVIVWIVGDATIKGSETGTSFKQALAFMDLGFNLHDTMIYKKKSVGACGSPLCYNQTFEYMFVFTKGKISTFNPIKDLVPKRAGMPTKYVKTRSDVNGFKTETIIKNTPDTSKRTNVWEYAIGFGSGDDKTSHTAVFPEKLVEDHIISWSNENDLVYDPFMGSGTTAKVAKQLHRNYLGSELSAEYVKIAEDRLK